jgi:hypothetical protein
LSVRKRFKLSSISRRAWIRGAAGDLGRQNYLLAPGWHDLSDSFLTFAVAVRMRGVDVANAQVDRVVQRFKRGIILFVHEEATARAEAKDRHGDTGSAKLASGNVRRFG